MSGWSGQPGLLVRGLALGGTARVVSLDATGPAREVCRRHALEGAAAQLAAEGAIATALLAAHIKGEERLQVQIQGESPPFAFMGEVSASGELRARLNPARLPRADGLRGALMAIKWDAGRELYRGVAEIERGTLEGALDSYLTRSQQSQGLVRVEATLGPDGGVESARGLLVERLPGLEEDAEGFEDQVAPLRRQPLGEILLELHHDRVLGLPFERLEEVLIQHHCTCSMTRVEGTLVALGVEEMRSLLAEQGGASATCGFCGEHYQVPAHRLRALVEAAELPA